MQMIGLIYIVLAPRLAGSRFKVGVTGIGRRRVRMRSIRRTTPGIQVPVFFAPVLFPYTLETAIHRTLESDHRPYRIGSGRTEWFRVGLLWNNLILVFSVMAGVWLLWALAALFIWKTCFQ